MRSILAILGLSACTAASPLEAQVLITSTSPLIQNFNSMGGNTTLPQGWRVSYGTASPTWLSSQTSVTYTASSGTPTANGSYAWGNPQRTDWAVGMLSPIATRTSVMMLAYNVSGQSLNSWSISYSAEQFYRNNADSFAYFYYSLNGQSWTQVSSGTLNLNGSFSPVGPSFDNPVTKTKSFTFQSPTIEQDASIYFRWEFYIAGPQGQGWGLDDITITPGFTPIPETSTFGMIGLSLSVFIVLAVRRHLSCSKVSFPDLC